MNLFREIRSVWDFQYFRAWATIDSNIPCLSGLASNCLVINVKKEEYKLYPPIKEVFSFLAMPLQMH